MSVKNYKVELEAATDEGHWVVVEVPTGQVVDQRHNCRDAKIRANVLNGGSGFNGYTPPFMLNRWVLPSNPI